MGSAQALILVFESYRANIMKMFMRVYDLCRSNLNATDDFLIFHFDMHSHVDSEFRELIRERFASLFVKDIKSEVIGQSSSRKMKGEKAQGLFAGDKNLRNVLSNATKSSSILTKAVVPKRAPRRDHDDEASPKQRACSRSRTHSPEKTKRGDRYDGGFTGKSSRNGKREWETIRRQTLPRFWLKEA